MKKYLIMFFIYLFNIHIAECKIIDEVIAIVDNSAILKSEIDSLIKLVNINNNTKKDAKSNLELYNLILDQLIVDKMSYQIALKKDIFIKDSDIDNFIENIAIQNNITKNEFLNKINNNKINLNHYREFIKRKIANNILYNKEIKSLINITDKDIEKFSKNFDFNKILNLFMYYDFYEIKIPYSKSTKNNEINYNKKVVDSIINNLKNSNSLNEINKIISDSKNSIKIEKINNKKLKNINPIYVSHFDDKINVNSIIGPLFFEKNIYILKINKIIKPDYNKLINEVNISHILIDKYESNRIEEINSKINNIKKDIESKKISFSEAAKKYSCSISSNDGGNLKWNIIDVYDKDFIKVIKSLKKGEVSNPFLSKDGFNLIKLINHRETKYIDFIKRNYSFEYLFNKKFYEMLNDWIKNKKKSIYIKIYN